MDKLGWLRRDVAGEKGVGKGRGGGDEVWRVVVLRSIFPMLLNWVDSSRCKLPRWDRPRQSQNSVNFEGYIELREKWEWRLRSFFGPFWLLGLVLAFFPSFRAILSSIPLPEWVHMSPIYSDIYTLLWANPHRNRNPNDNLTPTPLLLHFPLAPSPLLPTHFHIHTLTSNPHIPYI